MARKKSTESNEKPPAGNSAPAAPYVVLARKYRPQTFDDLIGQDAMVQTLSNAFDTGRIAQGYMLTGVRGVGKTTTARILARALNYETDTIDQPTIKMPELGRHCAEIMESRHPDVLEMDAASNTGVDNIRELIESARYKPLTARNKIYIVDEVHMLSKGAFNALLKTLEEPPEHVRFIFATTEIRKVPVTVLSRCQRFDLRRIDVPTLTQHLGNITKQEKAKADDDALGLISRAAEGSVRDALSILDQAIAMGSGKVSEKDVRAMLGLADRGRIFDVLDALFSGQAGSALEQIADLYRDGADPVQLTADLAEAVHVSARTKALGSETASEAMSAEERRRAEKVAAEISVPVLSRAWQMLIKGLEDVRRAPNPLSALEMVIIRLAYVADLPSPEDLIKTLDGRSLPSHRATQPAHAGTTNQGSLLSAQSSGENRKQNEQAPALSVPTAPADSEPGTARDDWAEAAGGPPQRDSDAEAYPTGSLKTFSDVIDLVAKHRDAKLKLHLEDDVSLVRFDGLSGAIELHLLAGAPPRIANELRERLNRWTGQNWVVVLSSQMGEPPIGEVVRKAAQDRMDALKKQPDVAAVLSMFPDAVVVERAGQIGSEENTLASQLGDDCDRDDEDLDAEKDDDSAVG